MSPRRSCDGGPHRAVQNKGSCCTGRPRRTVRYRKRPCGVREAHLSTGTARGGGSSAGCHVERMTGASGSRWRIVMAQVRRMPMRARWLQSRCGGDARRRHRRSPCARTPLNGLTKKSASADRPGPGFRAAKSESDSRRGRTSGAAERQRVCEANEQRRRPAEASPNGSTSESASADRCGRGTLQRKVGKRLERRRGSGTRPVSIVTGGEKVARLRSKRRGSGIFPAQGLR